MPLPDVPPGPDMVAAILIESNAVLLIRQRSHRGSYYVLPSGSVREPDHIGEECVRCAVEHIRSTARDLERQIGLSTKAPIDLDVDQIALNLGRRIGDHVWGITGRRYHYFAARGNDRSIVAGPGSIPVVDDPTVWMPCLWVPLNQLAAINLHPAEACAMCQCAAGAE